VYIRVDTKWRFQFFREIRLSLPVDAIIASIVTFFALAIITITAIIAIIVIKRNRLEYLRSFDENFFQRQKEEAEGRRDTGLKRRQKALEGTEGC
jgi:hypothetical protein